MSERDAGEWLEVVSRVSAWSPARRIELAKQILDSLPLPDDAFTAKKHGPSAFELRSLLSIDRPAPGDAEVAEWIEADRLEKYGR